MSLLKLTRIAAALLALASLLVLLKGILLPVILPMTGLWAAYKMFRFSMRR